MINEHQQQREICDCEIEHQHRTRTRTFSESAQHDCSLMSLRSSTAACYTQFKLLSDQGTNIYHRAMTSAHLPLSVLLKRNQKPCFISFQLPLRSSCFTRAKHKLPDDQEKCQTHGDESEVH